MAGTRADRATFGPLQMMKRSLDLTDEQVQKLEPILKEQQAKIAALRRDASLSHQDRAAKLKEIGDTYGAKFNHLLTTNQLARWHTLRTNFNSVLQRPPAMPAHSRTNAPAASSAPKQPPTKEPATPEPSDPPKK
ncbi:MAG: hypothetical protein C5B50_14945 [Verrucomicrobia bacterium]|nr:MAG: hypothetical protein C5B50_14945 [Verrucomicrobiota bacterium]